MAYVRRGNNIATASTYVGNLELRALRNLRGEVACEGSREYAAID